MDVGKVSSHGLVVIINAAPMDLVSFADVRGGIAIL